MPVEKVQAFKFPEYGRLTHTATDLENISGKGKFVPVTFN
jgi:hypothetical protein